MSFSVCSYNIGLKQDDYYKACKHYDPSLQLKDQEDVTQFGVEYNKIQEKTTELLTGKAQAYCLQEVGDLARPIIISLQNNDFEIVYLKESPSLDTAIALDTTRFTDISNYSTSIKIAKGYEESVAIAIATDKQSGQKVTFVSAHVPGFDFETADETTTSEGDNYCKGIALKLSEIATGSIQIIGVDTNANPEIWEPRFTIFSEKGFQLHRTSQPTNVNPNDEIAQEREIDFIFTKELSSIWEKVKSVFISTTRWDSVIKQDSPIGFNATDNASDHVPIFINVSLKVEISKIHQFWNTICQTISFYVRGNQSQT